jgi:hypothetical protein
MIVDSDFALAGRLTVRREECFFEAPYECQRIPEKMQPIARFYFDLSVGIAFNVDLTLINVQPI